ncbi:putative bifunctional diguanylate cyclase/phosphodiesterase [Henriciella litoralis]|uniref:putative bifunctional diguanylate cyclase/phosphodiesterase n=1 Tax=Henriciella litoralis TaxID=568102 RepID=UPI001469D092|nr:GGDEF and EAL domain-containing protein [Henriciella litoralis]
MAAFMQSVLTGQLTLNSFFEAGSYAVILGTIAVASRRDWHTQRVVHGGLLLLFIAYWAFTFTDFLRGTIDADSLFFVLFVPVFIIIGLDFRLQFALAPVHAALIWMSFNVYAGMYLSPALTSSDLTLLGITITILSGALPVLIALVQIARQATDARLSRVIAEKDHLASTDPLTGLLNRRAFLERVEAAALEVDTITLAFLDLNGFKPLNDQYGHAAGDAVLKAVATRLDASPHVLFAARPGGDEFAVALDPSLQALSIESAVANLHSDLARDVFWQGRAITVGTSIGYASLARGDKSLSTCLSEADAAMRRAKANGAGHSRFQPDLDGETIETDMLQVSFPRALSSGRIRPALQPIADAKSHAIVGYELLSRWDDPSLARQPGPDAFIPIAEKLGLLDNVLWLTLDETLAGWTEEMHSLAINVSPGQLQSPDFIDTLLRVVTTRGVKPEEITLEITEKVALRNTGENIAVLAHARTAGFSIALDDFGTGYSSLSMLDLLPLDKLKIDQSLVHADSSQGDSAILKGAIRLARELGLRSCVEGVSSEEIAAQMARLGADEIQGFWIGRPTLVERPSGLTQIAC